MNLEFPETFDPAHMLDQIIKYMGLKNDFALSVAIGVSGPVISKLRNRRMPVTANILVRFEEETGLSIRTLRDLMGDRRAKFRFGSVRSGRKPHVTRA